MDGEGRGKDGEDVGTGLEVGRCARDVGEAGESRNWRAMVALSEEETKREW